MMTSKSKTNLTKDGCIWHPGFGLIRHSCFVIFVILFIRVIRSQKFLTVQGPTGCQCRRGKISLPPSMVLGQPVGDIERRGSLAKPGAAASGRVPHLGPQDELPPNSKWAGPTIPARWDDRQRYSSAYGDSDTRYGLLRQQGPRPTPAPRPTP